MDKIGIHHANNLKKSGLSKPDYRLGNILFFQLLGYTVGMFLLFLSTSSQIMIHQTIFFMSMGALTIVITYFISRGRIEQLIGCE